VSLFQQVPAEYGGEHNQNSDDRQHKGSLAYRMEAASLARLWQQSDNVPFGQSRNVPLTAFNLEGARRTTADDPSRS
jgi:hypothetical protein